MILLEHEFYKASEVAGLLRLNTKTLYGWINQGRAFAVRTPSGGIRIPRDEVRRLLSDVAGGEGVDKHRPHE